jgi:hypothetical protein
MGAANTCFRNATKRTSRPALGQVLTRARSEGFSEQRSLSRCKQTSRVMQRGTRATNLSRRTNASSCLKLSTRLSVCRSPLLRPGHAWMNLLSAAACDRCRQRCGIALSRELQQIHPCLNSFVEHCDLERAQRPRPRDLSVTKKRRSNTGRIRILRSTRTEFPTLSGQFVVSIALFVGLRTRRRDRVYAASSDDKGCSTEDRGFIPP